MLKNIEKLRILVALNYKNESIQNFLDYENTKEIDEEEIMNKIINMEVPIFNA